MPDTITAADEMSDVGRRVDFVMSSDTLMGDIRDAMLDRLKAMPKPWTVMSEREQRDLIYGVENAAGNLIRQAALLIAANGYPTIQGQVEQSTIKDDIKTIVRVAKSHPDRLALMDAAGHSCILVIADVAQFMGERAPAKPDPEQPDMIETVTNVDEDGIVTEITGPSNVVKHFRGKNKPEDSE